MGRALDRCHRDCVTNLRTSVAMVRCRERRLGTEAERASPWAFMIHPSDSDCARSGRVRAMPYVPVPGQPLVDQRRSNTSYVKMSTMRCQHRMDGESAGFVCFAAYRTAVCGYRLRESLDVGEACALTRSPASTYAATHSPAAACSPGYAWTRTARAPPTAPRSSCGPATDRPTSSGASAHPSRPVAASVLRIIGRLIH